MTDQQLNKFQELLRLEKIDIVDEFKLTRDGIPELFVVYRAFPGGKEFYDEQEWQYLKEIGLVKDGEE